MMKFALLASGSKGNCFLLWDEALFLMVDCGSTKRWLTQAFQEVHADPADLDAVFITHDHSDHVSQLKMFSDHVIYSPVELAFDSIRVKSEEKITLRHMTVTPLALSHDARNTTGYVFQTWQEKLVYITDTGYLKDSYLPLLKGADYIILESNHDVGMLMNTSRPYMLKQRIASDSGHLCNEDCAAVLDAIVTEKTKMVVLAHISQQANTYEQALSVSRDVLLNHKGTLNKDLVLKAAEQFEIIKGGTWNEETDGSMHCCAVGLERMAHL